MQCAFYAAASSAASHPIPYLRHFDTPLTYNTLTRLFLSLDAVQRNVIRHLHHFLSLQAIANLPTR